MSRCCHAYVNRGGCPQPPARGGSAMRRTIRKWFHGRWILAPLAILTATVLVVTWASVNNPGPTQFVELDQPANVGFDADPNAIHDWADAGANATPRDCTATPVSG